MATKKETAPAAIDTKEIEKYRGEVEVAAKYATGLEVKNEDDYKSAMAEGLLIKGTLDTIVGRKEEITKPMEASLKSVRALFKPFEAAGEAALRTIKDKMLAWKRAEDAKAADIKAKLAAREERGTMKPETVAKKMAEVKVPEKTVHDVSGGSATTRVNMKYRVVDKSIIPLNFLEPDMTAIKRSFQAGAPVAGIEAYPEEDLSFRA